MFHCLGGVHHIVFCSVGLIDVLVENDETHYILIFGMSATVDVQHLLLLHMAAIRGRVVSQVCFEIVWAHSC